MKKLLLSLICLAFVFVVSAQKSKEEKVPAEAKSGFKAKYPAAQKVKWSIEKPGEFEVDFVLNKIEQSALVDAKGNVIETEIEVKESELPQTVRTTIAKDFTGFKLDEIEKSTDAKGVISFEMQAFKGKDKFEIAFDGSGKLISKEVLKKENEDKEGKDKR